MGENQQLGPDPSLNFYRLLLDSEVTQIKPCPGIPVFQASSRILGPPAVQKRHMGTAATKAAMLVAQIVSSNAPKVVF